MNQRKPLTVLIFFTAVLLTEAFHQCYHISKPFRFLSTTCCSATNEDYHDDSARRALLVSATTGIAIFSKSMPAQAKYGESSSMELPNYIEYLIEKNEMLDSEMALYKGPDRKLLLQRLLEANKKLGDIEALAEDKKWSQIQGVITGPLGTLAQTINQIATPDSAAQVKEASKKVKADVIAIGQAATKKNPTACADSARVASKDLEAFAKLAFQ